MFRCRMMRKPVTLVGAACTSAFVGLFVLDRVFLNRATCATSCTASGYPSYQYLQRNEAEKKVQHPAIRGFEVNYLPSNSPIEDRFVAGISSNLGAGLFSIIDGHKGYSCSDHLQKHLLKYVTSRLHKEVSVSTMTDDLQILMDMSWNSTASLDQSVSDKTSQTAAPILLPDSVLEHCLQEAFLSAENDLSNEGLHDIKLVLQGHSFTPEIKARVMRAIEGACAILALVLEKSIAVASTGDCRVVVGQKHPDNTWKAIPLSTDQNAQHEGEVERLKKAHPGEESTVIINNRVLGSLMPFRTFGDVDFKWEKKYLAGVVPVWANYFTPPYITAEPVVTHHKLRHEDKFMILASDGLWERISNEEAVNVVAETISESKPSSLTGLFRKKSEDHCCRENAATKLLWHSLGGTEESVAKLLNVPRAWSRMFRDDITVMVVFFSDEYK